MSMAIHVHLNQIERIRMYRTRLFGPSHGTLAVGVLLNILEGAEDRPKLAHEVALVRVVEVSEKRLDRLSSLVGLVEGDATKCG